jgi:ribosomal protein L11 methyltransferase
MPAADEVPRYPQVQVSVPAGQAETVSMELWDQGATGIEERDGSTLHRSDTGDAQVTLVAAFADEAEARRVAEGLARRFPSRLTHVVGDAWRDAWRAHFKPVRLGQRLVVRPSWESTRLWPGEVEVTLDPGRAFGSGTHETTRLVLREVDRRVRGGEHVLDVGCGSGILGVAALKLGARRVRAVDVDADAVPVAMDNARRNRVAARMRVSTTPVGRLRGTYDLVLANIETVVLLELADAIAARVAPRGTLVLSGVLAGEQDRVCDAFTGFHRAILGREGEWVAPVLRRRPPEG